MQTFQVYHLRTFNVAAIFLGGHPYIWRTTVRHDNLTLQWSSQLQSGFIQVQVVVHFLLQGFSVAPLIQ